MNYLFGCVIIGILVILYFVFKYSYLNTTTVNFAGEPYKVHNVHHNKEQAAQILSEVIKRNKILIEHLKQKYSVSNFTGMDPEKANRIDVIPAGNDEDDVIQENIPYLMSDMNYLSQRVLQLQERYNINNISEISPLNPSGSTSYTENKGEKLVLCLRNKTPNKSGIYEFHDINLIMFVVLHELTHVMNDRWGHDLSSRFWQMFRIVLRNAVECGIYTPVDYRNNNKDYCGMKITYNPLYDDEMKDANGN